MLRALTIPEAASASSGPGEAQQVPLADVIVRRRGAANPKLVQTLADYADDPDAYEQPARKVLRQAGADRDQQVVDRATELLRRAEARRPGVTGGLVGQLNAQGGRVLVVGGDVTGPVYQGDVTVYATAAINPRERRDRSRMLARVRRFWIEGVLEDSLHGAALQALGLEARPEAVPERWGMVLQRPERPPRSLEPGTTVTAVFDDLDGELLLLGAPGAGKTTLLLELARTLVDRAERDATLPSRSSFRWRPGRPNGCLWPTG